MRFYVINLLKSSKSWKINFQNPRLWKCEEIRVLNSLLEFLTLGFLDTLIYLGSKVPPQSPLVCEFWDSSIELSIAYVNFDEFGN